MRFGKKQPLTRYIHSKFGIAALLIVAFLLGRSVLERYYIERDMANRRDEIAAELLAVEERTKALEVEVSHISGERGIEEEIRTNFDVAREGERVAVLVGEESIVVPPPPPPSPPAPWWQFWRQ